MELFLVSAIILVVETLLVITDRARVSPFDVNSLLLTKVAVVVFVVKNTTPDSLAQTDRPITAFDNMLFTNGLVLFASLGGALAWAPASYSPPAKKPAGPSLCDKYTTALLKKNTAANQQTVLTLVVNTAIIGNYTKPNVGIAVPGILAAGTGGFKGVNLAPYFTGEFKSTNRGGKSGVSVNFLDGGGADPLKMNMLPTNTSSNQ